HLYADGPGVDIYRGVATKGGSAVVLSRKEFPPGLEGCRLCFDADLAVRDLPHVAATERILRQRRGALSTLRCLSVVFRSTDCDESLKGQGDHVLCLCGRRIPRALLAGPYHSAKIGRASCRGRVDVWEW